MEALKLLNNWRQQVFQTSNELIKLLNVSMSHGAVMTHSPCDIARWCRYRKKRHANALELYDSVNAGKKHEQKRQTLHRS